MVNIAETFATKEPGITPRANFSTQKKINIAFGLDKTREKCLKITAKHMYATFVMLNGHICRQKK